jgi:hypothetical protein
MDGPFPTSMVADIEEFFKTEHTRPPGQLVYDDVFAVNTFFPLQRKAEMREMMKIATARSPEIVMEIGADKGGSLYHWCKIPTVECVIACEIRGTPYKHLFEYHFPDIKFLWLEASSYDPQTVRLVSSFLDSVPGIIDVLFIDGDKSGFLKDFEVYLPMLSGFPVFMHDIRDPGPKESFDELKKRGFKCTTFFDVSDWEEEARKFETGIPTSNEYQNWLRHWKGSSCGVGIIDAKW